MARKADPDKTPSTPYTILLRDDYIKRLREDKAKGIAARTTMEAALQAYWQLTDGPWKPAVENPQTVADLGPEPPEGKGWLEWTKARLEIETREIEEQAAKRAAEKAARAAEMEPQVVVQLAELQSMTDVKEVCRLYQAEPTDTAKREALHRRIMEMREAERKARQSWQPVEV